MRILAAFALAATLATPVVAGEAPPPGGPGEILMPGSAPGVTPRVIATVMPPHVPEIAYQNMVRSVATYGLYRRDFAFLNQKAAGYRAANSRSATGEWELDYFYQGILPASLTDDPAQDDAKFAAAEAEAQDWATQTPSEPTPHIAYASLLIQHAQTLENFALITDPATPADAKRMQDSIIQSRALIARARAWLEAHKDLAAADPHWYVLMMDVAYAQDWDQSAAWRLFDEATQRYPAYTPFHYRYLDYLLHTTHFEKGRVMTAVGVAVMRSQATEGNQLYARLYAHISACGCDHGNLFRYTMATWPEMRESFEEIARRWPDPWTYDTEFYFACTAGDRADAVLMLGKIVNLPMPAPVWRRDTERRGACQLWATGHQPQTPFDAVPPGSPADPTPALLAGMSYFTRLFAAIVSLFI